MANNDVVTGELNYADRLWKTADALRGQVDSAEYKNVVLGPLFLKYISDSVESRRDDLRTELMRDGIKSEQLDRLLESRDEYTLSESSGCRPKRGGPTFRGSAWRSVRFVCCSEVERRRVPPELGSRPSIA